MARRLCPAVVRRAAGLGDLDRVDRDLVSARIVARVEIHLLTLAQSINAGALERGGMAGRMKPKPL